MQAVTLMSPAIAVLFSFQFTVTNAGLASPLAYLLAFPVVLMLGITLSQLASAFPSAGGYYTYISRTIHPRAGFLAGWLFFLYTPLVPGPILAFMGYELQQAIRAQYHVLFPWWAFFAIGSAVVALVVYRGVEISGKAMLVLGGLEILVVGLLSICGLLRPGAGGFNLSPFLPSSSSSLHGLYLAVVFSIFAYTGWEGAAPIAEESEDPTRNIPKATIAAIIFQGAFLVLCTWGLQVGWGTLHMDTLIKSSDLPPLVLARHYSTALWLIVLVALVNSSIAVSISAAIVSTRMWFAMGRSGALPQAFAKLHPRTKSPTNAVLFQIALIVIAGLGGVWWFGVDQVWYVDGLMLTFTMILIYSLANVGVCLYCYQRQRSMFNVFKHALCSILSTVALLWLGYKSLSPLPDWPSRWAPIIAAVWLVIGLIILFVLHRCGKEKWLLLAGQAVEMRPETVEELEHRPLI